MRCAWKEDNDYCFTTTALTSKIWLIHDNENEEWQTKEVADIGDASTIPLPVDISISSDDNLLWVNTWNVGMTRVFDVSDPFNPTVIYDRATGRQVNR